MTDSSTTKQGDAHQSIFKEPKVDGVKRASRVYEGDHVLGSGNFGVVVSAKDSETGEVVAIKKVWQDPKYKNRERKIMKLLGAHPNICELKHSFYSEGGPDEKPGVYLHLVLEMAPTNLHLYTQKLMRGRRRKSGGETTSRSAGPFSFDHVVVFTYQLCRAIGHLSKYEVCHRDVKPDNVLIFPEQNIVKLCDFGSAKILTPGLPNASYICSRYYRAPELIFGSTTYTTAIDIWSVGCIMAELLLGSPLFAGDSSVDQLVEIVKVLGTPTMRQIRDMNPMYADFEFPAIAECSWDEFFQKTTYKPVVGELLSTMLCYTPSTRSTPFDAIAHRIFEPIRCGDFSMSDGSPIPPLTNYTEHERHQIGCLTVVKDDSTRSSPTVRNDGDVSAEGGSSSSSSTTSSSAPRTHEESATSSSSSSATTTSSEATSTGAAASGSAVSSRVNVATTACAEVDGESKARASATAAVATALDEMTVKS